MVEKMGETAGKIWHYLEKNGDTSLPQLLKNLDEDIFFVYSALGWLAREDKIVLYIKGRTKVAGLK